MTRRIAIVLAAVLVVVAIAGCSGTGAPASGPVQTKTATVIILTQGVLPEIADSFAEGQTVRAKDSGALVGKITAIDRVPAVVPVPTSKGELNAASSPVTQDVRLTIEGSCTESDAGFSFGGTYLYVNDAIKYLTPYTVFNGFITSIKVVR